MLTAYSFLAHYGISNELLIYIIGMEACDIKKMKDFEDENRRLKQMFAELSLECRALKDIIEKKL